MPVAEEILVDWWQTDQLGRLKLYRLDNAELWGESTDQLERVRLHLLDKA